MLAFIDNREIEKILDHTPFLLTRCSRDLTYLYVSKAYAAMIGRAPEEIVGKPIIQIMGPQGFETIRPRVEAVLRGQQVEYEAAVHFTGVGLRQMRRPCSAEPKRLAQYRPPNHCPLPACTLHDGDKHDDQRTRRQAQRQ